MSVVLRASNLYKSYGSVSVLTDVSLEVHKGEVITLVGPSGAGKSTLLHLLGSLDTPDKGSVWLKDTDIHRLKDAPLSAFRNRHIGFVFQFHNLLPEFTAEENCMLPALIAGKSPAAVQGELNRLVEFLGIRHRMAHYPNQLSGGEQQRVAVARALINQPDIIFADEPSGNLDSKNAEDLHELFFQLRKEFQQTFVIVTHNPSLAALSDRSYTIRDGSILG
ncbi:MAG: ABC transporter ATP-binding protein [Cytophagaceae bacterium]|jgi:lipoprotein-releasing system ATP-binding protein|nr:ABC transporter ATP-binding protein [Cytophagaceae bacterium]